MKGAHIPLLSTHELQNPDRAGELALAVDFGTSVIRAALVDGAAGRTAAKAACRNRLDRYGRDILARIACCGESPEKREEVFAQAALALDDVLSALEAECGICVRRLPEMVLVANTTHMYLLLRQDPACICMPPYDIPLHAPGFVDGHASGLPFAGRIYFVPCRANYLGGDVLCALLAADLRRLPDGSALFDMGENGELVIRKGDTLYCGSCAAGCAIRADSPDGLCASDLTAAAALLWRTGVVNRRGRLQAAGNPEVYPIQEEGKSRASLAVKLPDGRTLRQADMAEFMQAKASVATMIDYMAEAAGLEKEEISVMTLTGRFGAALDPQDAADTGLLPLSDQTVIKKQEHAALDGAVMLLLDPHGFAELDLIYGKLRYVQLREVEDYLELMLPNLQLPEL